MRDSVRRALRTLPGGDQLLERSRGLRWRLRRDPLKHRRYVGDAWEDIGPIQRDFLVARGLAPGDILLDVGCGSLRGGRYLIEYLEPEHYLGMDQHAWLIRAGLKHELAPEVRGEKRPQFVVSSRFEFDKFRKRPTFGLAQSLFSHLTPDNIRLCLTNLAGSAHAGARFYATFVPKGALPIGHVNPERSDDFRAFHYDAEEILAIGRAAGWHADYIGDWGHPRGQQMLEFTAPGTPGAVA